MANVVKYQVIEINPLLKLLKHRFFLISSNPPCSLSNKDQLHNIQFGWIRGEGALTRTNSLVRQFNVVLLGNLVAGGLTSPGVNKYEATLTAYMPETFTVDCSTCRSTERG